MIILVVILCRITWHCRLWSAGSTKAGGTFDVNSDSSSDEEEEEEQGERRPVSQSLTIST